MLSEDGSRLCLPDAGLEIQILDPAGVGKPGRPGGASGIFLYASHVKLRLAVDEGSASIKFTPPANLVSITYGGGGGYVLQVHHTDGSISPPLEIESVAGGTKKLDFADEAKAASIKIVRAGDIPGHSQSLDLYDLQWEPPAKLLNPSIIPGLMWAMAVFTVAYLVLKGYL